MALLAEQDTVDERLAHCDSCENNKMGICKRCGCIIRAKVRFADQKCPIGLWGYNEYGIKSLKITQDHECDDECNSI